MEHLAFNLHPSTNATDAFVGLGHYSRFIIALAHFLPERNGSYSTLFVIKSYHSCPCRAIPSNPSSARRGEKSCQEWLATKTKRGIAMALSSKRQQWYLPATHPTMEASRFELHLDLPGIAVVMSSSCRSAPAVSTNRRAGASLPYRCGACLPCPAARLYIYALSRRAEHKGTGRKQQQRPATRASRPAWTTEPRRWILLLLLVRELNRSLLFTSAPAPPPDAVVVNAATATATVRRAAARDARILRRLRWALALVLLVLGFATASLASFSMSLSLANSGVHEEAADLRESSELLLVSALAQVMAAMATLLVPVLSLVFVAFLVGSYTAGRAADLVWMLLACHGRVHGAAAFNYWVFYALTLLLIIIAAIFVITCSVASVTKFVVPSQ
ncbi:hypothetical protein HU200_035774 [Digitaria exilis]|uniref:Uncharacterized protein n=1 Tax=Digitaria exilis TaxID=1010633 RepID=A0A835BT54_9POAL|nr:hypothetical protein HU200_035774 [Digitaria exilis]